jgi:hypothetical protein
MTNIMDTWRQHGFVPPSEIIWYQQKWKFYKNEHQNQSKRTWNTPIHFLLQTKEQLESGVFRKTQGCGK